MAPTSTLQRDRRGAAAARRSVVASRDRFWCPADLALPPSTAHHLLGELVAGGELRRVRRGLYWRGARTPLGMAPPSPEQVVAALAPGAGVGPAGLSAANLLRLSTQVPRVYETAVPHRAPTGTGAVRFVARPARAGRRTARLTPAEVAVLEVLEAWPDVVELPAAAALARLCDVLGSPAVDAGRLADAAGSEPGTVRARLRELLSRCGRADLSARVPPADRRTAAAALAVLSA